jgi:hypothetical protein
MTRTYRDPTTGMLVYSPLTCMTNTTISGNLTVNGNVSGKIGASNITSGTIDLARLPTSCVTNFNYFSANSGVSAPSWCKIITIYKHNEIYGPIKFNIIGARGQASGWGPNFDEDYYIRVHYKESTDFKTSYRNLNVSYGAMK